MATIIPLSEGTFTIGKDKIFIPFDVENDDLKDRSIGSLIVEIQPFLVQINGENILLDTGLGYHLPNGELQIHHNLRANGVEPEQINKVILSHLHKDHAGGITYNNKFNQRVLSFPNAQYIIYKSEFDYAMANPGASYLIEEFNTLSNSNNVVFYTEEKGWLGSNIYHEWSGGHCPHHQVITIQDGSKKIFFGGDEAPQLKQLKVKYIAKYDFDGKKSADLREYYAERGRREQWYFLFYHDIASAVTQL